MNTPWGYPDFDAHEALHFVTDEATGLRAIIAMHSTHLGPAAGGTRFWHYADDAEALTDALRLSRGMSYKNAMAGLPLGGGKAVVLANKSRTKTPEMLAAFGAAVNGLCGKYVTAEDVGMSVADMIEISKQTKFVAGLPVEGGAVGGDPGPHTSLGVFLGIKAAVKRALGKDSLNGLHIALQGAGSVAGGVARQAAAEGAKLSIADVDRVRAEELAAETGGAVVTPDDILFLNADVVSPCAFGAILTEQSIASSTRRSSRAARTTSWRRRKMAAGCSRAASSMRRTMSSMPAASLTYRRNFSATAGRTSCVRGLRPSRAASSKSGRRAQQPNRIQPAWPTPWRRS